jgi:hypothetical protein
MGSVFSVLGWNRPGVDTHCGRGDTFLPQFDPRPEQRKSELEKKRTLYEYEEKIPKLPVQVTLLIYN